MALKEIKPDLKTRNLRVYISAPIFGTPDRGAALFAMGERIANNMGWYPTCPPDLPPHPHFGECPPGRRTEGEQHNEACHFRSDLRALLDCDAIIMMPGWIHSWGCKLELQIAGVCGLQCYAAERPRAAKTGDIVLPDWSLIPL